jgi:hypothetical protein
MQTLKEFVEQNPKLVSRKESVNYPGLFVLKYTRAVFYDNLWSKSDHLLDCRGTVVDADYNRVTVPFTKIFNYKENGAGTKIAGNHKVFIDKKINGFMASVTLYNGQVLISTTGSLDSDFCGYARDYLGVIKPEMLHAGFTYMFEICHPEDPHIVPEVFGAHFLAVIRHSDGLTSYKFDHLGHEAKKVFKPLGIIFDEEEGVLTFDELLEKVKTCRHEGFVVIDPVTEETFKIKSPYYLFCKFLARVGTENLIKWTKQGIVKQRVEEEYYVICDRLNEFGLDKFGEMTEQDRLDVVRIWIEELL